MPLFTSLGLFADWRLEGTARSPQRARVHCERTRGRLCVFAAWFLVREGVHRVQSRRRPASGEAGVARVRGRVV